MSDPYVSVTKYKGQAVVQVRIGQNHLRYPLTKAGCLQAGRDIYTGFKGEVESWMNSSSVDFPQEVKKDFRWDVRELMAEGFREMMQKAEEPRKRLVAKMMAEAAKPDFQATLTDDEKAAYVALAERIKTNGG